MTSTIWINRTTCSLGLLGAPTTAWAQSPAGQTPSSQPGQEGPLGVILAILALLVVSGIAMKLYEVKRKRDEEGLILQARLSDALLLDPPVAGLPVVVSVTATAWGQALLNIAVTGTVPTAELREAAIQLVERGASRGQSGVRIEDRIVVDPLMWKRVA